MYSNSYDTIYTEMAQRNIKAFLESGNIYDANTYWRNRQHCMAIVAKGEWWLHPCLYQFMTETDTYVNPVLHHTFLVVRPWREQEYTIEGDKDGFPELIQDIRECGLQKYVVFFDRLILTPTSLLMVGRPTRHINAWRDKLRQFQKDRGIISGELYYNNIAHATLLRWTKELTPRQRFKIASLVERINRENNRLATLHVFGYDIMNASWLLKEATAKSLYSEYLP